MDWKWTCYIMLSSEKTPQKTTEICQKTANSHACNINWRLYVDANIYVTLSISNRRILWNSIYWKLDIYVPNIMLCSQNIQSHFLNVCSFDVMFEQKLRHDFKCWKCRTILHTALPSSRSLNFLPSCYAKIANVLIM